jgi:hypothetical protein
MRPLRIATLVALAVAVCGGVSAIAAPPPSICQAGKLRATGIAANLLLRCHASAATAGTPVDPECVARERVRLQTSFAQLEASGTCVTTGDADAVWGLLDAATSSVASALRPSGGSSLCANGKLLAAAQRESYALKLIGKQRKRPNTTRLTRGDGSSIARLARDFALAEARGGCLTTGDFGGIADSLHNGIGDLTEALWPLSIVGIRANRPPGWHLDFLALAGGGDVEFNNFASAYVRGGLLPAGGAAINIKSEAVPSGSLNDIAVSRAAREGLAIDSTAAVVVGGSSGIKALKHWSDPAAAGGGVEFRLVDVYAVHGGALFTFVLTYRSDDQSDPPSLFDALLGSVQFVQ